MRVKMRVWYGLLGLVLVLGVLGAGIFAKQLSSVDPYYMGPFRSNVIFVFEKDLSPALWNAITPHPGIFHSSPEDWSRLVYGARWTLLFGVVIALGRLLVGLLMGGLAGMGGRFWKWFVGRLYMLTSGVPPMLVYVLLLVLPLLRIYPARYRVYFTILYVIILVLVEAPRVMLVIQGRVEELQQEPFYEGALAVGNTKAGAFRRHLLPHLTPTLLTQFASEAARALLVMATLGVFGIFLSGIKIDPLWDPAGEKIIGKVVSALVPEWGTMLAEMISQFGGISTRPLLPATAFAVLVIGFMLLSDGLESLLQYVRRPLLWLKLNVRLWHLGVVALAGVLIGILSFHGGLPWGKYDTATAVLQAEIDAIAAGNRDGFVRYVSSSVLTFKNEQLDLFDHLKERQAQITGTISGMQVIGNKAAALVTIVGTLPDGSHLRLTRHALLQRSWGVWRDMGHNLYHYRSRLAEIEATFNPWDVTDRGAEARSDVQDLASFLDHTVSHVIYANPQLLKDGPLPITFFPSDEALAASMGMTKAELGGIYLYYKPGESLRFSPSFRKGSNLQIMEERMAQQLTKLAISQQEPNVTAGLMMAKQGKGNAFAKVNMQYSDKWVGLPILKPREILQLPGAAFDGVIGQERHVQSINLMEFLSKRLTPAQIDKAALLPPEQALQSLLKDLNLSEEQLNAQYLKETLAYIEDLSLLKTAEGQQRVPQEVRDAIPLLAAERSREAGVQLQVVPLKIPTSDAAATAYVLTKKGDTYGVERWEMVRWKDEKGTRWMLLPKDSWLLP